MYELLAKCQISFFHTNLYYLLNEIFNAATRYFIIVCMNSANTGKMCDTHRKCHHIRIGCVYATSVSQFCRYEILVGVMMKCVRRPLHLSLSLSLFLSLPLSLHVSRSFPPPSSISHHIS